MTTALRRFFAFPANWWAVALVAANVALAIVAPRLVSAERLVVVPPANNAEVTAVRLPLPPSPGHPLGKFSGGGDVFGPLMWGFRDALRLGLIVTLVTAVVGVTVGAVSAYAGGWVNAVLMRITDAFLAFPAIASIWLFQELYLRQAVVQITIVPSATTPGPSATPLGTLLTNLEITPIMLALMAFSWMPYARLINTNVLRLKQTDFVEAARALGVGHARILLRHLLPNAIAPAVVLAARDVGGMVVLAAAFGFIGMGDATLWGDMLLSSREWVIGLSGNPLRYWWTFVPATVALVLFGLGWNLLGDGLNRLLDPHAARGPAARFGFRPIASPAPARSDVPQAA